MLQAIGDRNDPQIAAALAIIVRIDPDILLLTRFDYDHGRVALDAFAARLAEAGAVYPYRFAYPPNAGAPSGLDLDGDGRLRGPGDAQGWGRFPGQGAMALLSRLPLDIVQSRDFSGFLWRDLPGALIDGAGLTPRARAAQRLSSTGHWDVAVALPQGRRLRLLAFSATPPVFDGPEDRNGRRNHDEIAFWRAYLGGRLPFLPPSDPWVIMGNANLDPVDGAGRHEAIAALLADPRLHDPAPESEGAGAAAAAAVNRDHRGDLARATAFWDRAEGPGSLRLDYVLPARGLRLIGAGVFWPEPGAPRADLAALASAHRLVWVDILPP